MFERLGFRARRQAEGAPAITDDELTGYPNNHNYRIRGDVLLPGRQLRRRHRRLAALYPEPLESFLDVGSCKGFFVLDASSRPTCRRAVGIDVHEPFVELARRVGEALGRKNVSFHVASLDEAAADPGALGGPFQTVLLIDTYHYLFWGSSFKSGGFLSHERILSFLAALSTERVIFSSPLELDECPGDTVELAAKNSDARREYTTAGFLDAAGKMFRAEERGRLGKRPLYALDRR